MPMPSAWGGVQPDPQQDPDLVAYLKQTRPELFANTGGVPQPVMNAGAQLKASSDANAAAQAAATAPPPDAGQNVPRGTAPGSTQALLDQINGQQLESLKQQGLSVDALKKSLGDLQGKDLPLNLQPLAALTDAWTGSHMAPNAAPEETAATRQAAVQKMQEAILKAQQGMSQDDIAMLKDKLQAQYHAEDTAQRSKDREVQREAIQSQRDAVAGAKKEKVDTDRLTHAQGDLNKDPTVVDATKKLAEVGNAREMLELAKTNPAARNSIAIDMARLVVPSRLNDTELQAFGGSKKAGDRVNQAIQDMKSGTLSDDNYTYLSGLVDAMEGHNQTTLRDRTEHHARQYARASGKDFSTAASDITGGSYQPAGPSASEVAAAKSWLADPANAKSPHRADVQKLVK